MKNQLIPQKRMNKNGVMVTKHVRDENSSMSAIKSLPAPTGSSPSNWKAQVDFLIKALHGTYEEYLENLEDDGMSYEEMEDRIERLDNQVLASYYESIRDNPGHGFEDILISALHNELTAEKAGSVLFITRLEGELDLEWSSSRRGVLSYLQARRLHSGLSHYAPDVAFPSNLLLASEEEQEKAATLINAVLGYLEVGEDDDVLLDYRDQFSGGMLAFEDTDLADLFLDYPDQAVEIIDIMQDRGTGDPVVLRAVLEAEVSAVRDGIL